MPANFTRPPVRPLPQSHPPTAKGSFYTPATLHDLCKRSNMPAAPAPAAALPSIDYATMPKAQRFAAFLIILGPEAAGAILGQLEPPELESVTTEMSKLPFLTQDLQNEVLKEFSTLAVQAVAGVCGGLKFVHSALEKGVGPFRAADLMNKVSPANARPVIPALQAVLDMETKPLANLLKHEPPQAVALVVSYLAPERASRASVTTAGESARWRRRAGTPSPWTRWSARCPSTCSSACWIRPRPPSFERLHRP